MFSCMPVYQNKQAYFVSGGIVYYRYYLGTTLLGRNDALIINAEDSSDYMFSNSDACSVLVGFDVRMRHVVKLADVSSFLDNLIIANTYIIHPCCEYDLLSGNNLCKIVISRAFVILGYLIVRLLEWDSSLAGYLVFSYPAFKFVGSVSSRHKAVYSKELANLVLFLREIDWNGNGVL